MSNPEESVSEHTQPRALGVLRYIIRLELVAVVDLSSRGGDHALTPAAVKVLGLTISWPCRDEVVSLLVFSVSVSVSVLAMSWGGGGEEEEGEAVVTQPNGRALLAFDGVEEVFVAQNAKNVEMAVRIS